MSRLLIVGILIISTMVRGERRALAASGCWPCADTGAVDCFVTLCHLPAWAGRIWLCTWVFGFQQQQEARSEWNLTPISP